MRKTLFAALFLMNTLVFVAQTNLREMVTVVRPVYTQSSIKFLNDFSNSLRRDGYKDAADLLKSYAEGGFGSGFVYADPHSKKKYVITNRHVVAQANSVTIEINVPDKPAASYANCPIVAADEQLDLAMIALPDDAVVVAGMNILLKTPEDGTEVFTGGYPGLGKDPSWQLGHGIISNNEVYNQMTLTGTDNVSVIQHTAQIDAGSSGGPLLVKNSKSAGGYDVIGINTWKAAGRENTNFAISGKSVATFIKETLSNTDAGTDNSRLKQQAEQFALSTNKNFRQILPFISSEYISNVSTNAFYDLLNAISDSARTEVYLCFSNGRPIDGVRVAVADAINKKFAAHNLRFSSMEETVSESKPATVLLRDDEKYAPSIWVMEQGAWRIKDLPSLKLNNLDAKGVSKTYGYPNSAKIGIDIPINSNVENLQYRLEFDKTFLTFVTYGISLGIGNMNLQKPGSNWSAETSSYDTISYKQTYFNSELNLGGQVPVKVGSVYVIPNVKGLFGMNFGEDTGGLNYGFSIGTEIAYKLTNKTYLIGGINYRRKFVITQAYDFDNDDSKFAPYSTFGIHLGITW